MEINYNNNPDTVQVPDRVIPKPSCGSCYYYDCKGKCTLYWNNLDECYYNPCRDDREPDELCEEYIWDEETFEGDF